MPTLVYETAGRFFVRHSVYNNHCADCIVLLFLLLYKTQRDIVNKYVFRVVCGTQQEVLLKNIISNLTRRTGTGTTAKRVTGK